MALPLSLQCRSSAVIHNFQKSYDSMIDDVQEIVFQAESEEVLSFLVKTENVGSFFGEYAVYEPSQIPQVGDRVFFTKLSEGKRIIEFITEEKFVNVDVKHCNEQSFGIYIVGISLLCILILFFGKYFYNRFKKSP